tara:strand:+ start:1651 stop:2196 length:546 start_codon:yes stop_codon:yes gene_type:complete
MRPIAVASLDDIKARCHEVGECWEWAGAVGGNCIPCACIPTAYPKQPSTRARRVTVTALSWEAYTGKSATGKSVWRTCCNQLCVNPAHLRAGTRTQMCAYLVGMGAYRRTPASIAAITKGKRKEAKLTMAQAREIRESTLPAIVLSATYGVHHSMVTRIRRGEAWRETVAASSIFAMGAAA